MTNEEALEIVWRCLPLPENAPERLLEAWLTIKLAVIVSESPELPHCGIFVDIADDLGVSEGTAVRLYNWFVRQLRAD
jgi:hypothetical protein